MDAKMTQQIHFSADNFYRASSSCAAVTRAAAQDCLELRKNARRDPPALLALGAAAIAALLASLLLCNTPAVALEPVYLAIPNRSIQHVLYPMAQEQGYMEQEGVDL